MAKITKIYTRTGDDGSTSLGGRRRVSKNSPRVRAYGTVDELNSQIGVALAYGLHPEIEKILTGVQNELFHLGADLCVVEKDKERFPGPKVEQRHVDVLEGILDRLGAEVGPLENFILPGGAAGAAHLHVARTVCRRAERELVALAAAEPIGKHAILYINRLSDALFVMARFENKQRGRKDVYWNSRA
jgi:cob(I)alamin adenosyltransferase